MIKVNDVNVTTFTYPMDSTNGSHIMLIEIVETEYIFEAWIRSPNYGVSTFMFGTPKKQTNGFVTDYDGFVEMVEANVAEYAEAYIDEYGE